MHPLRCRALVHQIARGVQPRCRQTAQVLECLKAEEAPLGLWLDIVKAYLAAGHTVHAEKMLREGTSAEVC